MNKCALCGNEAELELSHILPKFLFRYQKKSSPTGNIRSVVNPNRIVQDGEKLPFLCGGCEDLFSRYCEKSPGWELNGRLITAFLVDFEPRKNNGVWASYPCYKVHFSNNETRPFSIKKALHRYKNTASKHKPAFLR